MYNVGHSFYVLLLIMIRICIKICVFLTLIASCTYETVSYQSKKDLEVINEVNRLLYQINNKTFNDSLKFNSALRAYEIAKKNKFDSLTSKSLFSLIKISYGIGTKDSFLFYYPKALKFSKRINDTLILAKIHNYTAYFYQKHQNIDSAYYHFYQGSKYFKLLKNDYQTGKMLLNMAIIQKNQYDYKGSEEVTKQALEYLLKTEKEKYIASAYNNLGIINDELNKLPISIKYHNKALTLLKKLKKEPILAVESLNNIAAAYKDNGNYKKALFILTV